MKQIWFIGSLVVLFASCAKKNTSATTVRKVTIEQRATEHHAVVEHDEFVVSKEVVVVKQPDETSLSTLVIKTKDGQYIESLDGYTLLKNEEGIYEYAVLDEKTNKLVPGGEKANDVSRRFNREVRYVNKLDKHLRNKK